MEKGEKERGPACLGQGTGLQALPACPLYPPAHPLCLPALLQSRLGGLLKAPQLVREQNQDSDPGLAGPGQCPSGVQGDNRSKYSLSSLRLKWGQS